MVNNGGEGFLLTTKFCKSANDTAILVPNKRKIEGNVSIQPEDTETNNQKNMTTKQLATQKIYAIKLRAKLGYPVEDRMRAATKHLNYSIKGMLEVCKYCNTEKRKNK